MSALFIWWERHAKEPLIPLRLFKDPIFRVSVLISLVSGLAMFAAIIFLPEYQQVVRGYSATKSGLLMLPLSSASSRPRSSRAALFRRRVSIGCGLLWGRSSPRLALALEPPHGHDARVAPWCLDVCDRRWYRLVYAGHDLGGPKLDASARPGHRDFDRHLLPLDGRLVWHRDLWRGLGRTPHDPHQRAPARAQPLRASAVRISERRLSGAPRACRLNRRPRYSRRLPCPSTTCSLIAIPFVAVAFVIALFLKEIPLRHQRPKPPRAPRLKFNLRASQRGRGGGRRWSGQG
jgi:hypothetical protein